MDKLQTNISHFSAMERKISDGENLLRRASDTSRFALLLLFVGVLLMLFLSGGYKILGLIVLLISIFVLANAEKHKSEIEEGLSEYRGQKAEILATLLTRGL
ncbi:MAG: hypothetical protein CL609_20990 [Anaerolineaceae bacterium]|nr:hypothetical protein [Anaerolineaceae bacterium]